MYLSANFRSFPLSVCSSSLFAAPWLLPGCFLAMPLCSGAPLAKRSSANVWRSGPLPKRSSPEAVLYRCVAAYPTLLCRSGPLPQRSSAEAAACGSTLPPNGSWTETERRKFVCVCVCKLPRRSGTSARGGNKKRDSVFNCPLRRTHGYQLKPSATHISNTTTALQSNTARPCACRKLGK